MFGYILTIATGRLADNATLTYTQQGTACLKFRLLATLGAKQHERVEAVNCVLWGERAEKLANHCTKGKIVTVDGEPVTSSWEKEGVKHYRTEIRVNNFKFTGGNGKAATTEPDEDGPVDYE